MDNGLLEYFRLQEPLRFRRLVTTLNASGNWQNVVKALNSARKPLHFSIEKLTKMEASPKPGEFLLNELIARQFSMSYFSEILYKSKEFDALACVVVNPEPLEFIVQPFMSNSDLNFQFGEEMVLNCRATEIPPPQYQWYHNNLKIECNEPNLIIKSFRPEHRGYYHCIASRWIDHKLESVQSNPVFCEFVDSPPEFEYPKPEFFISQELGSNLVLTVDIKSIGECKLQWIKNGNEVMKNETNPQLNLNNLQVSDFTEYQCQARNSAGEVYSKKFILKLLSKPPTAKIALLIANQKYDNYVDLTTPCNDIVLLSEKLYQLNYHVISLINLSKIEMRNVIDWYFDLLLEGSDAFFCFVGHGFQHLGNNYMLPVDSPEMSSVNLVDCICDHLVIMKAKKNKLRLLVSMIDMCLEDLDRQKNPQIFKEMPEQYTYKPCNSCNLVRVFSTSSYQSSYEAQSRKNGFYIDHISKYLLKDKPIIDTIRIAHEDFERTKFSKLQKPSLNFEGGHKLKWNSKPLDNFELDAKIKQLCNFEKTLQLKFMHKSVEDMVLSVSPHRKFILNAIDINFYNQLYNLQVQFDTTPDLCSSEFNIHSCGMVLTIGNLQKVKKQNIFLSLKIVHTDGKEDASLVLDVGMPLIVAADLWYEPQENVVLNT